MKIIKKIPTIWPFIGILRNVISLPRKTQLPYIFLNLGFLTNVFVYHVNINSYCENRKKIRTIWLFIGILRNVISLPWKTQLPYMFLNLGFLTHEFVYYVNINSYCENHKKIPTIWPFKGILMNLICLPWKGYD